MSEQEDANTLEQLLNNYSKITKKLQRNEQKITGEGRDTTQFRQQINNDLNEFKRLNNEIEDISNRYRGNTILDNRLEKLVSQCGNMTDSHNQIEENINQKLRLYQPVDNGRTTEYDDNQPYDEQTQLQSQVSMKLQVVNQISELEDKNEKVGQIVEELHQTKEMVEDLQEIVQDQQEDIDKVELNVESTKQNVETGTEDLVKAEEYQKAARKKMCIVLICILVLCAIIIGSVCGSGACSGG